MSPHCHPVISVESPSHSHRILVISVTSLSSLSHPCCVSVIPVVSPLHPQLLIGLGVGGVLSMVLHQSMHHPPHKQLLMRLGACGVSSMVGVVVVCHLSAMVSGSKGVREASVTWHMSRGREVPTVWVSHSLGLLVSLITLLYLNNTPHILFCWGGGGWHRHGRVWVVSPLSVITSRLEHRKQKKQISKFIKTRNKKKRKLT